MKYLYQKQVLWQAELFRSCLILTVSKRKKQQQQQQQRKQAKKKKTRLKSLTFLKKMLNFVPSLYIAYKARFPITKLFKKLSSCREIG